MTRLTLNAIMRATFGERADALDEDEKRAYKDAIERGARQEGEGRLP